jgi:glycosyltransferase involved in cell wall biosynthesis
MADSGAHPLMSVVVCTRDRPDSIGHTLASIAAQTYPHFELLVVDQSRDDSTRTQVESFRDRIPRVRYLRLERPGLSRAYNLGIDGCSGELIAFTDDDAVAPPDWLQNIATAFSHYPEVSLLYGQVLLPSELAERENRDGVTPSLPIPRRRQLDSDHGFEVFGMGANFAARRQLFVQIGGFDEVLGGGGPLQSSQDFDFAYRVFKGGLSTLLEPEVIVHHYGFRPHDEWPATVRSYGIGVGGFYFKHVRLGDMYAARLLFSTLLTSAGRLGKRLLTRKPAATQWTYLANIVTGIWASMHFPVDRHLRLYRSPT